MSSDRKTPLSKRSPSILVTDVRNAPSGGRSAPFVKLKNVSVDNVLSNTSEVPSAHARRPTRPQALNPRTGGPSRPSVPRPLPRLTQNIPSRSSKTSQKLVLIPSQDGRADDALRQSSHAAAESISTGPMLSLTDVETLPREKRSGKFPRVTSYFVADGFRLKLVAEYLKHQHRARTRLYDEVLFADYLLPLLPGNGMVARVQSSLGDNRTMERLIDISEQGDHHFEYFSGLEATNTTNTGDPDDFDPSEPQDFSPRPSLATDALHASTGPAGQQHGDSPPNSSSAAPPGSESASPQATTPESVPRETQNRKQTLEDLHKNLTHAAVFILNYGVVVFWNFTEAQEKAIIADLTIGHRNLAIRPFQDNIETEEFNFRYSDDESGKPRVFNDMITLTSTSHMIKLSLSHAIAQSTKLSRFEDRMQDNMREVKYVPKTLALTGKLGMKRSQVLQISGRLFKLRVDVNLSSNILDTPEFFWDSEPSLHPLYAGLREYLEIDQRILVLNERCLVFLDFTGILADSIAEGNMGRITVIVIVLIVLSICVSLTEILIRFVILKRLHK